MLGDQRRFVTQADDILSGMLVFAGTRAPVKTLFDYLAAGDRSEDFLVVIEEQAQAVIECFSLHRT